MTVASEPRRGGQIAFILLTSFLNLAGIGIINPVFPFIVSRYTEPADAALAQSLLFTSYSLFQFLAVPTLGALSDRFGRRPVLLVSLLGSAAGYVIFGIGGALWVLFLGRIIDGITGGNLAAIYAYAADITKPEERTRFFGLVGSFAGLGFVLGPALGSLLYEITKVYESPVYFAAVVTLLNVIWGYFAMPESLSPDKRASKVSLIRLNPLTQMSAVFRFAQLRFFLVAVFIWQVAFAILQANVSVLTKDQFNWTPSNTGLLLFIVGTVSIIAQVGLIRLLLPRLGEWRIAVGGLFSLGTGFIIISLATFINVDWVMYIAAVFVALGNGLTLPSLTGLLSQGVSMREQGVLQGGNQSVQALGRVIGPIYGGWMYTEFGHAAPYLTGSVGLVGAILMVFVAIPPLNAYKRRLAAAPTVASDSLKPPSGSGH